MIKGVVAQKLQSLDQILMELYSLGKVGVAGLEGDWRTRRAEFASLTAREYEDEIAFWERALQGL